MTPYKTDMSVGLISLLLTDIVGLLIPWLLKNVIDRLPHRPSNSELLIYSGVLFVAAGFQGLFRFGWRKYLFGPSREIERDILNKLFDHFLKMDLIFFQKWNVGDLMSRATNDLRAVRDFMGLGLLILFDCIVVIVSCVGMMFYINPALMSYCLIPLPVVSFLFYWFSKNISIQYRVVQENLSEISSLVQENLAGIRVLHAYVQEHHQEQKFESLNQNYLEENMRLTRLFGLFTPSLGFIIGISAMISLWFGGKAVISGNMTLGLFVAFNGYLMMLSWPVMGIGYVFNLSQKGLSAIERLEEILHQSPLIESNDSELLPEEKFVGDIEFSDVTFSYFPRHGFELKSIRLQLKPGKTLALIGTVGAGKSTLARLIPRLLDAESGDLRIAGRSIRQIPLSQLRYWVGYVDQGPYLFSTSIRNNIAFGKPGAEEKEICRMAMLAGLEPDLAGFPDGLETLVGERGVSLSGGQKQRIALARALIREPRILILDDAFSSLDIETEEKILSNIQSEIQSMTTLIITHRLSTVRNVDEILVLKNGCIVEHGSHEDLIQNTGYYQKVFKNQLLAREMEILIQ